MTLSDRFERTPSVPDNDTWILQIIWDKVSNTGLIRNGETLKISYTTDSEGKVVASSVSIEKEPPK